MNKFEYNRSILESLKSFNLLEKKNMKRHEIKDKSSFQIHYQNKLNIDVKNIIQQTIIIKV